VTSQADVAAVAAHYDRLDELYREAWGEHVHHGLWLTGDETVERAAVQLAERVIAAAEIEPGDAVCDVGCGYGATSRMLAREHGARVTAFTVSSGQFAEAQGAARPDDEIRFELRDWLRNDTADESQDAVVAIESIAHMADKAAVFGQCARVLKPGGRLVVCDWLEGEQPAPWQRRLLLEPICREGRLPGMLTSAGYAEQARAAGLEVESSTDLTRNVSRTWRLVAARAARLLARERRFRRLLLEPDGERAFALSLARIPLAYRTGAMRYGMLVARRPVG